MEKNKRVGVLFSGGLDSTYLIWKNLSEGNEVVPIHIEIKNNGDKPKLERNRIELLWDLFNKEFQGKIHNIIYALSVDIIPSDNLLLKQVPIWILGLLYSQNHGVQELQVGYVCGDDAIAYIDDIKKAYKGFSGLQGDKLKEIKFPLIKESKYELISKLPYDYKQLLVSCENPKVTNKIQGTEILDYIPCGECPPCKKIMSTDNYHYGLGHNYKKIIVEKAFQTIDRYSDDNVKTEIIDNHKIYERELPIWVKEPVQLKIDFGVDHKMIEDIEQIQVAIK